MTFSLSNNFVLVSLFKKIRSLTSLKSLIEVNNNLSSILTKKPKFVTNSG